MAKASGVAILQPGDDVQRALDEAPVEPAPLLFLRSGAYEGPVFIRRPASLLRLGGGGARCARLTARAGDATLRFEEGCGACRIWGLQVEGPKRAWAIVVAGGEPIIQSCRILNGATLRRGCAALLDCDLAGSDGDCLLVDEVHGRRVPRITGCSISQARCNGVALDSAAEVSRCRVSGNGLAGIRVGPGVKLDLQDLAGRNSVEDNAPGQDVVVEEGNSYFWSDLW